MRAQTTQAPSDSRSWSRRRRTTRTPMPRSAARCPAAHPHEMDPFLGGTTEMVIELDSGTAGIPWELLDTDRAGAERQDRPWAIRAKLLREAAHEGLPRAGHRRQAGASVLVIGEPDCDPDDLPRAARRPRGGARGRPLLHGWAGLPPITSSCWSAPALMRSDRPDARRVINALFERKQDNRGLRSWRIVHIAGHGEPPDKKSGNPRGVVLSDDMFLGPREVRSLRGSCRSWCS